jgi:hypothetical protein
MKKKLLELCRTTRGGLRRYFADGRRISHEHYELLGQMSRRTECFYSVVSRGKRRDFKTINL